MCRHFIFPNEEIIQYLFSSKQPVFTLQYTFRFLITSPSCLTGLGEGLLELSLKIDVLQHSFSSMSNALCQVFLTSQLFWFNELVRTVLLTSRICLGAELLTHFERSLYVFRNKATSSSVPF